MRGQAGSVPEISVSGLEIFPYELLRPVNFTLKANGKREFVPRDQVFRLPVIYQLLPLPFLSITTALCSFYLLIFFILRHSQREFDANLQFALSVTIIFSLLA